MLFQEMLLLIIYYYVIKGNKIKKLKKKGGSKKSYLVIGLPQNLSQETFEKGRPGKLVNLLIESIFK